MFVLLSSTATDLGLPVTFIPYEWLKAQIYELVPYFSIAATYSHTGNARSYKCGPLRPAGAKGGSLAPLLSLASRPSDWQLECPNFSHVFLVPIVHHVCVPEGATLVLTIGSSFLWTRREVLSWRKLL